MTLPELIKALEAAEGPSREIDGEISLLLKEPHAVFGDALGTDYVDYGPDFFNEYGYWAGEGKEFEAPAYTASVDAAISLFERILPGWRLCFEAVNGKADDLYILGPEYRDDQPWLNSSKPVAGKPIALGICLAVLRARLSQDGGGDE